MLDSEFAVQVLLVYSKIQFAVGPVLLSTGTTVVAIDHHVSPAMHQDATFSLENINTCIS